MRDRATHTSDDAAGTHAPAPAPGRRTLTQSRPRGPAPPPAPRPLPQPRPRAPPPVAAPAERPPMRSSSLAGDESVVAGLTGLPIQCKVRVDGDATAAPPARGGGGAPLPDDVRG